jgi:hypothetical protein
MYGDVLRHRLDNLPAPATYLQMCDVHWNALLCYISSLSIVRHLEAVVCSRFLFSQYPFLLFEEKSWGVDMYCKNRASFTLTKSGDWYPIVVQESMPVIRKWHLVNLVFMWPCIVDIVKGKEPNRCDKVCSFYCLNMFRAPIFPSILMMGMLVPETCWGIKTAYFVESSWFFTFYDILYVNFKLTLFLWFHMYILLPQISP